MPPFANRGDPNKAAALGYLSYDFLGFLKFWISDLDQITDTSGDPGQSVTLVVAGSSDRARPIIRIFAFTFLDSG